MFAVGDNVLYGTDGVCTIADHGMRDAESRMNAELAHVLSIAPEEVPAYVAGKLGEQQQQSL